MNSIRNRLTFLLVCGMSLLLVVTGIVLGTLITSQLVREFDRALLAKAQALIALTEEDAGVVKVDMADAFMPEFGASERPEYFVLWSASGLLIEKSHSLGEYTLPRLSELTKEPVFDDITLSNGLRGRLIQMAFVPRIDDEQGQKKPVLDPAHDPLRTVILSVARDREHLDALLKYVRLVLATVGSGVLLGIVGLVRGLLRIGLHPLIDIQRQVAQLDANSLNSGIHVHTQTQELAPVVEQLNRLLQRLEAAFSRERQFSSAVAHELRTPLSELRTLTEVSMRWPQGGESIRQYFTDAHDICLQMERIVVTLLTLRYYENQTQWVDHSDINLLELVEACWQAVERDAHEKALIFQCEISPSCTVHTDRDILMMIVSNLLDNAVTYSPSKGQVYCVATSDMSGLELTIGNTTADLTSDDMVHLFERFWRKEPARSDERHLGLGLSIVKACSDLLDLNVKAKLDVRRRFSISLSFTPSRQSSGAMAGAVLGATHRH